MTTTEWRYDARQGDPLTPFRIPVVSHPNTRWMYHVCVVVSDPDDPGYMQEYIRPSDVEVGAILVALDYALDWYFPHYRQKMIEKHPFDIDSGTNTVSLGKLAKTGGWQYRRMTWTMGPYMVPSFSEAPEALLEVLDRCYGYGRESVYVNERWEAKKAAHPEIFTHPEVTAVWLP